MNNVKEIRADAIETERRIVSARRRAIVEFNANIDRGMGDVFSATALLPVTATERGATIEEQGRIDIAFQILGARCLADAMRARCPGIRVR